MQTLVEIDRPDALSDAHRGFMLAYIEFEQAREAALIEQFWQAVTFSP
jgi:hypothetical protein